MIAITSDPLSTIFGSDLLFTLAGGTFISIGVLLTINGRLLSFSSGGTFASVVFSGDLLFFVTSGISSISTVFSDGP